MTNNRLYSVVVCVLFLPVFTARLEAEEERVVSFSGNESLRISTEELPVLERRAGGGDVEAALRLADHYGSFLDNSEKRNRNKQIHYYEIAAACGSQKGIENLIFVYALSDDRYDFSKACRWRRALKQLAALQKLHIQSDAEWYYALYWEYFVGRNNKRRGLCFLECAANLGSAEAQQELIDLYSNMRNSAKAAYWKRRKENSDKETAIPHQRHDCCLPSR